MLLGHSILDRRKISTLLTPNLFDSVNGLKCLNYTPS